MSYKNGSIIGVDNPSSALVASGVWDLNAAQEAKENSKWPLFISLQLLESSSVSSNSNGHWRTGTYSFTGSDAMSGTTGRFVVHHYGTIGFQSDVQYDNIVIPTPGGNVTYDFEVSAGGWETTITNVGNSISTAYTGASFTAVLNGGSPAGRWLRDAGGTGSSNTGNTTDGSGNSSGFYLYTETSGTHPLSMLLRGPVQTLATSGTLTWREGYWGQQLSASTRDVYWIYG